jgi:hypothetical protein
MQGIQSIRDKFPQYSDLSDAELAMGVYGKFYSDMPIIGFAKQVGLDKAQSLDLLKLTNQKGKGLRFDQPSVATGGTTMGVGRNVLQGLTLGAGDEIVAGGTAAVRKIMGDDRSLGDVYGQELERERARIGQFEGEAPIASTVSEIAGAAALPIGSMATLGKAAATGLGYGAASGFLSGEGGVGERAQSAAVGATLGGMFGAGFKKASDMAGSGFERYLSGKAAKAVAEGGQSVEQLKAQASALYDEARKSGATILKEAFDDFVTQTINKVSGGVSPEIFSRLKPSSSAVLDAMQDVSKLGKSIGIDDLEGIRRLANVPAGKVTDKAEQQAAMMIIDGIDDFISNIGPDQITKGSVKGVAETFKKARGLWSRMRKTETISDIIETAKEGGYAGGFESGLKTQIGTILRNKKKRRGFSKDEIALLSQIQQGSPIGRVLAGLSYLGFSPSGGRTAPAAGGMATGAIVGGLAGGGPLGALVGAGIEVAGTTALRAVREMDLEKRARTLQQIISSGRADEVMQKSPEAFKMLQEAANAMARGATQATAGNIQ